MIQPHNNLGRKIKQLRIIRNYSQEYMADCLGISQGSYSNIEKKDGDIPHDRLKKIADIFGVSIDDIENIELGVTINIMNNSNKGNINGYINTYNAEKTTNELIGQTIENLVVLTQSLSELVKIIQKNNN